MYSVVPGYPKQDLGDIALCACTYTTERRATRVSWQVDEIPVQDFASESAFLFATDPWH